MVVLLDAGCDIDAACPGSETGIFKGYTDLTALACACILVDCETVRVLIDKGANPNGCLNVSQQIGEAAMQIGLVDGVWRSVNTLWKFSYESHMEQLSYEAILCLLLGAAGDCPDSNQPTP